MNNFQLNVLIVEDNLSFSLELQMLIEEIGYNVLGRADNSGDALDIIFSQQPDFILMDIDINGKLTGTEIGARIKHLSIPILYITSFGDEQHYAAAQKSTMVGYLVKPVEKYTLRSTIQLAISNLHLKNENITATPSENKSKIMDNFFKDDFLFFKKNEVFYKVALSDISYIKSSDNYCETHTHSGEEFVARITISKMEKLLPPNEFMRIHRSYIVRLDSISKINFLEGTVNIDHTEIPVSRANRKKLEEMIRKLN